MLNYLNKKVSWPVILIIGLAFTNACLVKLTLDWKQVALERNERVTKLTLDKSALELARSAK